MLIHEYFPHIAPVEIGENQVRTTVTVVNQDAPESVADDAPDFNEIQRDGVTEGGLTTHDLASAVIPSEQYRPTPHDDTGDAIQSRVNDRIATSGAAAAKEETGEWGHGTMKIVEGIEPAIPATPFDGRYFAALPHAVESTDYMTPGPVDNAASGEAQAAAVAASQAAQSPYSALLGG